MSAPYVKGSETSEAAAKSIKTDKGRAAVLAVLRQHPGGLTDEEIQGLTGLSPSTERPRRVELWRSGAVEETTETRKTKTGRAATVWRISQGRFAAMARVDDYNSTSKSEQLRYWRGRAELAEAACDALRRQIDELQRLLAKVNERVPEKMLGWWGAS